MPRRKKAEIEDYGPLTDEDRKEIMGRCEQAFDALEAKKEEQRSANGVYREHLKHAKERGMDPDAIRWALKERAKRTPEERGRFYADASRCLGLLGVPVGFQLDMFGSPVDAQTAANTSTPSDHTPGSQEAVRTARAQGDLAAKQGQHLDANNPYGDGSPEHGAWRDGFLQSVADADEEAAQSKPATAAEVHDEIKRRRKRNGAEAEAPVPA